jgi:hypothetical protein
MANIGLPFYIGHPDHEAFKARYTDTKAYGRIKELEARDDGLYGNVKWSGAGKTMVNEEMFHGHSVNWRVRKDTDGNWRPFSIKSVGFTNEPNIPVMPITHANEFPSDEIENDLQQRATTNTKNKMSNENEARVPAGQSGGGQWTGDGASAPGKKSSHQIAQEMIHEAEKAGRPMNSEDQKQLLRDLASTR